MLYLVPNRVDCFYIFKSRFQMETNIYLIVFVNTASSLPTRKKKLNDIVLTLESVQNKWDSIHWERGLTGISRFPSWIVMNTYKAHPFPSSFCIVRSDQLFFGASEIKFEKFFLLRSFLCLTGLTGPSTYHCDCSGL